MECLPIEDLCRLDIIMTEIKVEAAIYHRLGDITLIGTFNNRDYYYTWLNNKPVIVIESRDAKNYESPDFLPPP